VIVQFFSTIATSLDSFKPQPPIVGGTIFEKLVHITRSKLCSIEPTKSYMETIPNQDSVSPTLEWSPIYHLLGNRAPRRPFFLRSSSALI